MAPKQTTKSAAVGTTSVQGNRVFKPRPARSTEERLPKLYHGLTDQVDGGHFQNAIKTCRKILALDPASLPAFQTLLFLSLHTDDYASALALLDAPPTGSTDKLQFERAYCLYRLHREKEALSVLQEITSRGRKEDHLEAQITYRLGDYERAQHLYDDLLAGCDPSSSEHPDILTNVSATAAHVDFLSHGFHSHLSAPPQSQAGGPAGHVPAEADLETFVPSLPTGWATGGVASVTKQAPVKPPTAKAKKPRHKLPKGAVEGKPFTEDPDRWLPVKQRASFITAQSKKKGGNMSMGVGITQGSTSHAAGGAGGGGNAGGKKKKGKK